MQEPQQAPAWTGETWFKPKPGATASTQPHAEANASNEGVNAVQANAPAPREDTSENNLSSTPIQRSNYNRLLNQRRTLLETHPCSAKNQHVYTPDGPDTSRLTSWRQTFVKPTQSNREYRIDDEWQHGQDKALDAPWTGSTNFEEQAEYKEHLDTDNEDPQAAKPAGGVTPKQPTPQERAEHNLTHLPYRAWCSTCVASTGKADSHTTAKHTSKLPVIQVDFTNIKASAEKTATPILTETWKQA